MRTVAAALLSGWLVAAAPAARAEVINLPQGGRAATVMAPAAGRLCGPLPGGWQLAGDRRTVRPPSAAAPGPRSIEVKVVGEGDSCERPRGSITLVATGAHPQISPANVLFAPDEGRLEVEGQRLEGMQVVWRTPGPDQPGGKGRREGRETCLTVTPAHTGRERCVLPVSPGLPLDSELTWLPAGGMAGDVTRVYDLQGDRVPDDQRLLRPARVIINQVVARTATVDVSLGPARVPLHHPLAVAAVDCGQARCELAEGAVLVRSVPAPATSLALRFRLAPRVSFARGDALESQVNVTLPLVQCPLALVSGPPLRDADDAQVVVRVDPRCAREGERARWSVGSEAAEVRRVKRVGEQTFVIVRMGRVTGERVTIVARRPDLDAAIIGSITAETAPVPRPRVTLELPQHGKVEFIPTNRDAVLTVAGAGERARLVPLAVEGAYTVRPQEGRYLIRGDDNAGGFVALRFGLRVEGLPPELGAVDVAVVSERVQRAVREASVPAPFSSTADGPAPLAELTCNDLSGKPQRVTPGRLYRVPFDAKDSCRLVIHRNRIKPEFGVQEVLLEVESNRQEGGRRPESSFTERLVLVPGAEPRVIPLRGGGEEFDRIVVRLSHVLDESRYALQATARSGLPSVQWSLGVQGGRLRLYATAAIPAGLYRMNKPTGQLTLNFGVLSRITWLDDRGKEGLFGAEVGLMGMGLIQRPGNLDYPPTIGAVAGLGVRVPLGGGAAVGVHVWAAYEFRDEFDYYVDPKKTEAAGLRRAPKVAFIFGPSISIGNVGVNL